MESGNQFKLITYSGLKKYFIFTDFLRGDICKISRKIDVSSILRVKLFKNIVTEYYNRMSCPNMESITNMKYDNSKESLHYHLLIINAIDYGSHPL